MDSMGDFVFVHSPGDPAGIAARAARSRDRRRTAGAGAIENEEVLDATTSANERVILRVSGGMRASGGVAPPRRGGAGRPLKSRD